MTIHLIIFSHKEDRNRLLITHSKDVKNKEKKYYLKYQIKISGYKHPQVESIPVDGWYVVNFFSDLY